MQPEGLNRWSFLYLKTGVGKLQAVSQNLAHSLFLQIQFYWKTATDVYLQTVYVCARTHTNAPARIGTSSIRVVYL